MLYNKKRGGISLERIHEIVQEVSNVELCTRNINSRAVLSPLHWHNNFEICQPINKPCRFLVDGEMINAQPGDIIVINEQTVHRFLIDEDETQLRVLQFSLKILLKTEATILPVRKHITKEEIDANPMLKDKIELLSSLLDKENITFKESGENLYVQSLLLSFYFLLMENFSTGDIKNHTKKERKEFYKITQYVNNHFNEGININSLATKFFISRGKLTRLFLKYSGIPLTDYIISLRIKNVNQMLFNGSDITSAVFESGFQSIRTFNNLYKKHMGMTPSQFIKQKNKKEGSTVN